MLRDLPCLRYLSKQISITQTGSGDVIRVLSYLQIVEVAVKICGAVLNFDNICSLYFVVHIRTIHVLTDITRHLCRIKDLDSET